jgi:hypothetical protein
MAMASIKCYFEEPNSTRREIPIDDDGNCSANDIGNLKIVHYCGPNHPDAFLVGQKSNAEKYPMPEIPGQAAQP